MSRVTRPKLIQSLPAAFFAVLLLHAQGAECAWEKVVLDSTGDVGKFCRIEVGGQDALHVVYLRADTGTIKLISRAGGAWGTPRTVDGAGTSDGHCDVTIGAGGSARVSFRRSDTTSLWFAGPERSVVQTVGTIASNGDVGRYISLCELPAKGLAASFQDATAGSLQLLTADSTSAWSGPLTVDAGPNRGTHSDLTYRAGGGIACSEYDSNRGALVYADPVLRSVTENSSTIAAGGDVGRYPSLLALPGGVMVTSCQAMPGSLVLFSRISEASWAGPFSVDPGPGRGSYSGATFGGSSGFAFSEYDSQQGMLVFAAMIKRSPVEAVSTAASTDDAGRFVASARGPGGRVACSFYQFQRSGFGCVRIAELQPDASWLFSTVAPTIGRSAADAVHTDLDYSPAAGRWHVAFRVPEAQRLYCGMADSVLFHPIYTDVPSADLPAVFSLHASPNPFNASTVIRFDLPVPTAVSLVIYDARGRRVRVLSDSAPRFAGRHALIWDGRDERGHAVASGVYFARFSLPDLEEVRRLVLVK